MVLKGTNVLVTGASKGIGRACAEAFAEQGANIIINYVHDEKAAQEVAKATAKHGVKTLVVQADITVPKDVDAMFEKIKAEFDTLDVLVNNAGVPSSGDVPGNLEVLEQTFNTFLLAQVRVTNAARGLMTKGKIVFISSIHGKLGHGRPDVIAYSAIKAGLESYMKNLAKALAPDVLVNAIEPGRTLTPSWGKMDDKTMAEQASGHLINRWIKPNEVADGAVFLAKNDAMCGEVLVIDGGMSLKVLG